MQENYIIYVQDTETTGLDLEKNEIIEASFLRILKENGKTKYDQKTWLLRALNKDSIQEDALKINGHKKEDILGHTQYGKENYKLPSEAIFEIEAWVNEDGMSSYDRVFAGQNPNFDLERMVLLWKNNNAFDTFPFLTGHSRLMLDTKEIALFIDVCLGIKRERYNLGSLVKDYGVKRGKAHRADEDTRMTADLLMKFVEGMSDHIKTIFGK